MSKNYVFAVSFNYATPMNLTLSILEFIDLKFSREKEDFNVFVWGFDDGVSHAYLYTKENIKDVRDHLFVGGMGTNVKSNRVYMKQPHITTHHNDYEVWDEEIVPDEMYIFTDGNSNLKDYKVYEDLDDKLTIVLYEDVSWKKGFPYGKILTIDTWKFNIISETSEIII